MKLFNTSRSVQIALLVLAAITVFVVLFLNLKVHFHGVAYYQISRDRHIGGAFESSGSTSRYALTEMIVENGRMDFDKAAANFASPDVAGANGKYFSLFAPGVSFLAVPFYYLGKIGGDEQFATYLLNVVFAVFDVIMIALILKRLGFSPLYQIIPGLIFIFGTSAFSYSLYLTQHMISAFLVLASIYITLFKPSVLTDILLGMLYGIGLLVDIPNAFLLIPPVLFYIFRHFEIEKIKKSIMIKFKYIIIFMALGLVPLVGVFGWYNKALTGSPTVIAQLVGRIQNLNSTERIDKTEAAKKAAREAEERKYGQASPFQTRFMLNGLYILLISDERGWLYYSPILLISIIGIFLIYRKEGAENVLFVPVSIILMNILMYAMFGDPWGGWSFGARYMIPAAAVAVLFIPVVLQRFRKNPFVILCISGLIIYSIYVNALGAITTTEVPPKQEAIHLSTPIPYTYDYNFQLLDKKESYSLIYTMILKMVEPRTIWLYESALLSAIIVLPLLGMTIKEWLPAKKKQ